MMHEDKLSQDQRIRLEAIAQANALYAVQGPRTAPTVRSLIANARKIEAYILTGKPADYTE